MDSATFYTWLALAVQSQMRKQRITLHKNFPVAFLLHFKMEKNIDYYEFKTSDEESEINYTDEESLIETSDEELTLSPPITSSESESESSNEATEIQPAKKSVLRFLYPDSDDDMVLAGLVPKFRGTRNIGFDSGYGDNFQSGLGVVTRRQGAAEAATAAAVATAAAAPRSPVREPKNKTSAKLKAKNRTKPVSAKPGPSNPPEIEIESRPSKPPEVQIESRATEQPDRQSDFESETGLTEQDEVEPEESRLSSTNLFEQETKVFENEDFILLMQKIDHQRQKVKFFIV